MEVLLLFVRHPELGKVKTRLAATLGDEEALRIYRFLLENTRTATRAVPAERWVFYADEIPGNDAWETPDFRRFGQQGADLGARMRHAFEQAFAAGAERVVIIGSDCPELTGELLQQAFEALQAHDAVLGPATDGGYYLLGLRRPAPGLFENIAWSTDAVLAQTLDAARDLGLSVFLLPELTDIDREEDWAAFVKRTRGE